MIDTKEEQRALDAKRREHGADTPIGYRCSNAVEQLKSYEKSIAQIAELELAAIL